MPNINAGAPRVAPNPNSLAGAFARLKREEIEQVVEAGIARLDELDGDADVEPNGDELDGSLGEDDFADHSVSFQGPGCPVADPDMCLAGDDRVASGPIVSSAAWSSTPPIGCEDDNEPRHQPVLMEMAA